MVSDYHNMHVSKFSRYYDFHVSMIWQQKGPLYELPPIFGAQFIMKRALALRSIIRNYQYQEFGRALVATITPSL